MGAMNTPENERPLINIVGERVALGPLRRDLLPFYLRWRNDFSVARTLDYDPGPETLEARMAWYERVSTDQETVRFTVYERATGRPIGLANLHDLDHRHGTAEFGLVIGEQEARGRGYGTEVTRLMLDFAFTALGLHSVMLRVYAYNLAGQRTYQKAGFRELGRRRESWLFAGRRWDEVYMECLASDFESTVLDHVFVPDPPG
ncbi:MAG: GNAT family N-acetyltransferase [Chloroflexota bacterium]|nr:GNAT family N-acetyltransferase [Chloroflexota bacterium]